MIGKHTLLLSRHCRSNRASIGLSQIVVDVVVVTGVKKVPNITLASSPQYDGHVGFRREIGSFAGVAVAVAGGGGQAQAVLML